MEPCGTISNGLFEKRQGLACATPWQKSKNPNKSYKCFPNADKFYLKKFKKDLSDFSSQTTSEKSVKRMNRCSTIKNSPHENHEK